MKHDRPTSDAGTSHQHGHMLVRDAAAVVTALSEAYRQGIPQKQRVAWLLENVGRTVQPGLDFAVLLMDSIDRWPSPRVVDSVCVGPSFDEKPPAPIEMIQRVVDQSARLRDVFVTGAFERLRNPTTYIYSIDTDAAWFQNVYRPLVMVARNWVDVMTGVWAGSDQRLVVVHAYRRAEHAPFDHRQRDQLSLITRAVAPVMDSELFAMPPEAEPAPIANAPALERVRSVPAELRRTLAELLHGFNMPEIASMSAKMVDEIEIEVRQLLGHFAVHDEGELIALFVDQRVLELLDSAPPEEPEPGANRRR